MIDETITADNQYSREVSGSELARPGSKAQATNISAQVVRPLAGAFHVELEAAVNAATGHDFTKIGEFRDSDEVLLCAFPVSEGCLYRFKHVSGASCRVRMTG